MANDVTQALIEIIWNYIPPTYFEEIIILDCDDYSIEINDGLITAKMPSDFFDSQPCIRDSIAQKLDDIFIGAVPIRRLVYEIQGGTIERVWPDGRRDRTIVTETAHIEIKGCPFDLIYTDNKGVVHNTRQNRIDSTRKLAELSARYASTDNTARKILDSYYKSLKEPENELIYLYEIWDALKVAYGDQKKARKVLGIKDSDRRKLTNLSNSEPLNQGRHRGEFAGKLRDATSEELENAREIATTMLVSYLEYLDEQQNKK